MVLFLIFVLKRGAVGKEGKQRFAALAEAVERAAGGAFPNGARHGSVCRSVERVRLLFNQFDHQFRVALPHHRRVGRRSF